MLSREKKKLIAIVLIFCFICAVAFSFTYWKNNLVTYPDIIEIHEITFTEIDGTDLLLTATLLLDNPNNIDITLTKINAKLFVDEFEIGNVNETNVYRIEANGPQMLTFPAKIDLQKVSRVFPQILKKDLVSISVEGMYSTDAILTDIEFVHTAKKAVSMQREVDKVISKKLSTDTFSIDGVRLTSLGFLNTGIDLEISIKNDFGVDFEVTNIQCDLNISGDNATFGNWQHSKATIVEAKSFKKLDGQAKIRNASTLLKLTTSVFGSKKLFIDCRAKVGLSNYIFNIPFNQSIKFESIVGL